VRRRGIMMRRGRGNDEEGRDYDEEGEVLMKREKVICNKSILKVSFKARLRI